MGYSVRGLEVTRCKSDRFLKEAEIGFAEMYSVRVRIMRGISNVQASNPIRVVPPKMQLLTIKKHDMESLKEVWLWLLMSVFRMIIALACK